jgi:hypothetical protein
VRTANVDVHFASYGANAPNVHLTNIHVRNHWLPNSGSRWRRYVGGRERTAIPRRASILKRFISLIFQ